MTSNAGKQTKKRSPRGGKEKKAEKSDILMSENMEQELLSEHAEHHRGDSKKDFYKKKTTPRPD